MYKIMAPWFENPRPVPTLCRSKESTPAVYGNPYTTTNALMGDFSFFCLFLIFYFSYRRHLIPTIISDSELPYIVERMYREVFSQSCWLIQPTEVNFPLFQHVCSDADFFLLRYFLFRYLSIYTVLLAYTTD